MGTSRQNRKPLPAPAPSPAHLAEPIAAPPAAPSTRSPNRRIGLQIAAILGLSAALGFTFNAANPIGVRFGAPAAPSPTLIEAPTNFNLISTNSILATAKETAPPVPLPPPPVAQSVPIPRPPVSPAQVHTPVVSATNLPHLPAPVTGAVAPTNPAPIHWLEAKPLAAAGQAVLVDVRPRPVYDAGHIPDAVSLPETSSNEEFRAFLKLVPTNSTLIVYCASTSCSQSKRVADRLVTEFHYAPVKYMTGGYQEYQQQELAKPQPPSGQ